MASNSEKCQEHPHAQVATPPDSPSGGSSPKHARKHNQSIVQKIHQLLSDMKGDPGSPSDSQTAPSFEVQLERLMAVTRDGKPSGTAVDAPKPQLAVTRTPPNTPCQYGSEPVTVCQLIELLEFAVEAQGRPSSSRVEHEEHGDSTGNRAVLLRTYTALGDVGARQENVNVNKTSINTPSLNPTLQIHKTPPKCRRRNT